MGALADSYYEYLLKVSPNLREHLCPAVLCYHAADKKQVFPCFLGPCALFCLLRFSFLHSHALAWGRTRLWRSCRCGS